MMVVSHDYCDMNPQVSFESGHPTFGCADVGTTQSVTMVVTDAAGNSNSCQAAVSISDYTVRILCSRVLTSTTWLTRSNCISTPAILPLHPAIALRSSTLIPMLVGRTLRVLKMKSTMNRRAAAMYTYRFWRPIQNVAPPLLRCQSTQKRGLKRALLRSQFMIIRSLPSNASQTSIMIFTIGCIPLLQSTILLVMPGTTVKM